MTYQTILVAAPAEHIGCITFNRPDVRNALSLQMVEETHAALDDLKRDQSLKALIFTGAGGKAFVSGADIAELKARDRHDALSRINNTLCRAIEQFPAPTIAAITGYALGGGCEVAMACDLRVCSESAKFGQPEVALGILPGAGATYRMPRLIGLGMARELIFTGRIIDAAEALRIGLVNRVVADAQVFHEATTVAQQIGKNSTLAVRMAKTAINLGVESTTDTMMALESTCQAVLFEDSDKHDRMAAFLLRKGKA